jgi:single-strand DNA-binding protein
VGDVQVACFRVAATPRRYHRQTETWVDGHTQWYAVTAWRALADNCKQSLRRGDPVVVQGRLTVSTWTGRDGDQQSSLEIEAVHVGARPDAGHQPVHPDPQGGPGGRGVRSSRQPIRSVNATTMPSGPRT